MVIHSRCVIGAGDCTSPYGSRQQLWAITTILWCFWMHSKQHYTPISREVQMGNLQRDERDLGTCFWGSGAVGQAVTLSPEQKQSDFRIRTRSWRAGGVNKELLPDWWGQSRPIVLDWLKHDLFTHTHTHTSELVSHGLHEADQGCSVCFHVEAVPVSFFPTHQSAAG